jgi:cystathionine beta-synthase
VVGVGTGGTISGVGKYLKEQNPNIKIWGIDTYGSVFKKYHETGIFDKNEIYPYITEGIGEDIIPANVDFEVIDRFEKVTDKDAALATRELARVEGILVGNSAGAALAGVRQLAAELGPDDLVVVLFHDHASRYVGKMFNDDWMRDRGFLEEALTVRDVISRKQNKEFWAIQAEQTVKEALQLMKEKDISQVPVLKDDKIVGCVTENLVLSLLLENPLKNSDLPVGEVMVAPLPEVDYTLPLSKINHYMTRNVHAVMSTDKAGVRHIITQYDIIQALR